MKIGLFFGSFNPIHIGHLALANYLVSFTDLEKVWFVVSPHNPLKEKHLLLSDEQRLEMVKRAVAGDDRLMACDIEFDMPQPNYTNKTLKKLQARYPEHEFVLIIGGDNLVIFEKWRDYTDIAQNFDIYIYPRPGVSLDQAMIFPRMTIIKAPIMEISSTFIREAIKEGKDIRHFVPFSVFEYIERNLFYR